VVHRTTLGGVDHRRFRVGTRDWRRVYTELDSIMNIVRSRLDLSLSRLLGEGE
jgi:hypothetical protein